MDERKETLVEIMIHIEDHNVDRIAHIKSELRNNWHFEGWFPTSRGFHGTPNEDVNWKRNGEDVVIVGQGMARISGDTSPEQICKKLIGIAKEANGGHCAVAACYRVITPSLWTYVEIK